MLPRTQYVDSDGHSIAYQVIGSGPVDAFFEPGLLSHLDLQWCDPLFGGFLHQLASSSRLIITDQRGVGLSDACATIPTIDERVADMVAVADAVGTEQMFVIGHCHGGPPAIVFAATYPQRVAGLVLMSTFAKGAADADRPGALSAQDFDQWLKAIDNWGEGRSLTYFNPSRNDGPVYRQLYATFERAALTRGMARAAVASTLEIDVTAALKSVAAPTLVLHCSDDWMSIEAAKDIAAGIPSAHLVELDGADHAPFMGAASQDVLVNILEFIGRHQRSAPERVQRFGAILMTDIVSSTKTADELGDAAWADLLAQHDAKVRDAIDHHRGDCIKFTGDGYLATFTSCEDALRCACALQRTAEDFKLTIRCGVHAGGYEPAGHDVIGLNVITASRLMSAARGSQTLVSDAVSRGVAGAGFQFTNRKRFTLKGLPENVFASELGTTSDPQTAAPRWLPAGSQNGTNPTRIDRLVVAGAKRFPQIVRAVFAKSSLAAATAPSREPLASD